MIPSSPSPLPSARESPQSNQGFSSFESRIPASGDEAYREILESCRHFYAFETPSTPFAQTKLLPRLEDSIMMLEQKRKAKVSKEQLIVQFQPVYFGSRTISSPLPFLCFDGIHQVVPIGQVTR